jgi:hypothetical protein
MPLLAQCESSNNVLAVNWNDRGSPSYGLYQWKEASWIRQIRKYGYLERAEDAELMNFIFSEEWQDRITLLTLLEPGGYKNWLNCFHSSVLADKI